MRYRPVWPGTALWLEMRGQGLNYMAHQRQHAGMVLLLGLSDSLMNNVPGRWKAVDHAYAGTVGFDAHPYRTESDPWDFVDRCGRSPD